MRRTSWAVGVALVAALTLPAAAAAERYGAGAPGSGDPFFPLAGNGGYDARHYSLALGYAPGGRLTGHVAMFARATESLSQFDLDLRDFYAVAQVTVDGKRAAFSHHGQELVIRPADKLRRGQAFVVSVDYAGTPEPVVDPDDAIEGWVPTADGAFVVGEPQGAPGWFPVNDSLHDKATYDFAVTVPAGNVVMANGVLVGRDTAHGRTTWRWREDEPMVSYLATATNGRFQTRFERTAGLWRYDAVDPQARESEDDPAGDPVLGFQRLDPEPEIVRFFSSLYGDYAFSAVGGIIDWAPDVGYALETQTKPNYDRIPDPATVVHELSHQWWGDAVTIARWPDIWLNEGFATWSEWIYDERHGGPPAQARFDEDYATPEDSEAGQDLWFPAPAALPGPEDLFGTPVYDRGAMTLQALRVKIGDRVFFRLLRDWYRFGRDRNVTTAEFMALAERESGLDLRRFFRAWLFEEGRPKSW